MMTNDERRNEIQRLADRHQAVCEQQIHLGREIEAANYQMSPDMQTRLGRLIEAEKQARAEFDAAREGWHETVYVKPIR
jgi:hypothetical protein